MRRVFLRVGQFGSLAFLAAMVGCASAGEVVELNKMTGNFDDNHKAIHIVMDENPGLKNDAYQRHQFENILSAEIGKTKVFDQVSTDAKSSIPLKLHVKIQSLDEPNGALTVFAAGAAKAEIRILATFEQIHPKKQQLTTLNVTGNSSHKMTTSVGGFGVDGAGSYTKKAMSEAASRVAKYIAAHSKKAEKKS